MDCVRANINFYLKNRTTEDRKHFYLRTFVQSYSPPIPTSTMATSTFSDKKTLKAITVKNLKYGGMSFSVF
jgi:hypothetical protein